MEAVPSPHTAGMTAFGRSPSYGRALTLTGSCPKANLPAPTLIPDQKSRGRTKWPSLLSLRSPHPPVGHLHYGDRTPNEVTVLFTGVGPSSHHGNLSSPSKCPSTDELAKLSVTIVSSRQGFSLDCSPRTTWGRTTQSHSRGGLHRILRDW